MDAFALASVAVLTTLGPIVAVAILLVVEPARPSSASIRGEESFAANLGFSLEYSDAIAGRFDARFVRVVWSFRDAMGNIRGGARPVTYCERTLERRLGLHLALSTGWPWGGPKKMVPGLRRPISVRCDSPDHKGSILAAIAPIANDMPRTPVTAPLDRRLLSSGTPKRAGTTFTVPRSRASELSGDERRKRVVHGFLRSVADEASMNRVRGVRD